MKLEGRFKKVEWRVVAGGLARKRTCAMGTGIDCVGASGRLSSLQRLRRP